jgi:hypothetical protein
VLVPRETCREHLADDSRPQNAYSHGIPQSTMTSSLTRCHLDKIANKTISLDELPNAFQAYIDGTVTGRIVVEIAP